MASLNEEKLTEQFLPIVKPDFMLKGENDIEIGVDECGLGARRNGENLGIRFCRKKFKCVIIFMLLIISVMVTAKEFLIKIDDDTIASVMNILKASEKLEKELGAIVNAANETYISTNEKHSLLELIASSFNQTNLEQNKTLHPIL